MTDQEKIDIIANLLANGTEEQWGKVAEAVGPFEERSYERVAILAKQYAYVLSLIVSLPQVALHDLLTMMQVYERALHKHASLPTDWESEENCAFHEHILAERKRADEEIGERAEYLFADI